MSSPAARSHPNDAITTERLLLRPLSHSDSQAVFEIRSDPKVFYWTEPDTREKSGEWLKTRLGSERSMVYTVSPLPSSENPSPQVIGLAGSSDLPEVGHVFRPSSWGHGYATEALKAWIQMYWQRYADGHPGLDGDDKVYLKARTGSENDGSRGVLRKCGFELFKEEEVDDERPGAKENNLKALMLWFRLARP